MLWQQQYATIYLTNHDKHDDNDDDDDNAGFALLAATPQRLVPGHARIHIGRATSGSHRGERGTNLPCLAGRATRTTLVCLRTLYRALVSF